MKTMLFSVLSCALLLGGLAYAGEHDRTKSPTTAPTTKPVNSMCIMHAEDPVDNRETITYEGKVIGFCCEDCKHDFEKDPKKYVERLNK